MYAYNKNKEHITGGKYTETEHTNTHTIAPKKCACEWVWVAVGVCALTYNDECASAIGV